MGDSARVLRWVARKYGAAAGAGQGNKDKTVLGIGLMQTFSQQHASGQGWPIASFLAVYRNRWTAPEPKVTRPSGQRTWYLTA